MNNQNVDSVVESTRSTIKDAQAKNDFMKVLDLKLLLACKIVWRFAG